MYAVRESIKDANGEYHAVIEELKLGETNYTVIDACPSEFEFDGDR